jgi:AraC-like DNA-binding protein/quercetin dioxygenase-like cupin family protein
MVRNIRVEVLDDTPRPLIVVNTEHEPGKVMPWHAHRRCQLLYGEAGAVVVTAETRTWFVPPGCGMWIPSGVRHQVRMIGHVTTRSLYVEPAAAAGLPPACAVLGVSSFMRNLIAESIDLPVAYDPETRAGALMTLLHHELQAAPVLPLSLAMPSRAGLARECRRFLVRPSPRETIEQWRATLGMSRRAFTRLFRRETGMSFVAWRQQACLMMALPRLVGGEPVTSIALDVGYNSPAAFTSMFKRKLGSAPTAYVGNGRTEAPQRGAGV